VLSTVKVLVVSNLYHPYVFGGAEKVVRNLAEALVARRHDVIVVAVGPGKSHKIAEINGVRVHYLPNWNVYFSGPPRRRHVVAKLAWRALDIYNPLMASVLGGVLEVERPDVVNTHNISGFSVSAWHAIKTRGLPLVHTVHDYYLLCLRGSMYRNGRTCRRPCTECRFCGHLPRQLSELADVVIPVSRSVLEKHERSGCFVSSEKIVIHDRGAYERALTEPQAPRETNGTVRFGFLGRLHPAKGVRLLLRSFMELPFSRAELLIAGAGTPEYERELKVLAGGHNGIRLLGFVSPGELLRQVDVLVVPSLWHDPSPLVVTEAMAHGVPVIGSLRGGIPELMGERTGWTFEPDEPGGLMRAMQQAIDSSGEFSAMGERARQRARQFSTDSMVEAYLSAYSRAIETARGTREAKLPWVDQASMTGRADE
jgi:glycosyltransferase involved in cell wall biosynthesis